MPRANRELLATPERISFILTLVRDGCSRSVITQRFGDKYDVKQTAANDWYNRALSSLVVVDPLESKRLRASIVEMYHSQIAACQIDLASIDADIDCVNRWWEQKNSLSVELADCVDDEDRLRIGVKLGAIPRLTPFTRSVLVESKCRIRDRMIKVLVELARIHGLFVEEMPWLTAVRVLLDRNLLPAQTAEVILNTIAELTGNISTTQTESDFN